MSTDPSRPGSRLDEKNTRPQQELDSIGSQCDGGFLKKKKNKTQRGLRKAAAGHASDGPAPPDVGNE